MYKMVQRQNKHGAILQINILLLLLDGFVDVVYSPKHELYLIACTAAYRRQHACIEARPLDGMQCPPQRLAQCDQLHVHRTDWSWEGYTYPTSLQLQTQGIGQQSTMYMPSSQVLQRFS
jgi:hypothetical protein